MVRGELLVQLVFRRQEQERFKVCTSIRGRGKEWGEERG